MFSPRQDSSFKPGAYGPAAAEGRGLRRPPRREQWNWDCEFHEDALRLNFWTKAEFASRLDPAVGADRVQLRLELFRPVSPLDHRRFGAIEQADAAR